MVNCFGVHHNLFKFQFPMLNLETCLFWNLSLISSLLFANKDLVNAHKQKKSLCIEIYFPCTPIQAEFAWPTQLVQGLGDHRWNFYFYEKCQWYNSFVVLQKKRKWLTNSKQSLTIKETLISNITYKDSFKNHVFKPTLLRDKILKKFIWSL